MQLRFSKLLFFWSVFLLSLQLHAQNKEYKVVPVLTEQTLVLETLGERTRNILSFQLPAGTKEWYYSLSVNSKTDHKGLILNLSGQLSTLLEPSGLLKSAINQIKIPAGTATCDVFVLDKPNADIFRTKKDKELFKSQGFKYDGNLSRKNFANGTIQEKNYRKGTIYLGFRNPASLESIEIHVEVAALVEVPKDNSKAVRFEKLANNYLNLSDTLHAVDYLQKSLAADSNRNSVRIRLFKILALQKGLDSAAQMFNGLLEIKLKSGLKKAEEDEIAEFLEKYAASPADSTNRLVFLKSWRELKD